MYEINDYSVCNDIDNEAEIMYKTYSQWFEKHEYDDFKRYFWRDRYYRYVLLYNVYEKRFNVALLTDNTYIQNTIKVYKFPNEDDFSNAVFNINDIDVIDELYDDHIITRDEHDTMIALFYESPNFFYENLRMYDKKLYDLFVEKYEEIENDIMLEDVYESLKQLSIDDMKRLLKEYCRYY